ncbi:MAG: thioredoxin-like domain-containing protein, partial [Verrucomicrobiota bacterium]
MKTFLNLILALVFMVSAHAEFSTWTRSDGKTAELDLLSVISAGGVKSGIFKMRSGQSVTIKASSFTQADANRLAAWAPPPPVIRGKSSVFDKVLDGNLLKVDGKELKTFTPIQRPEKYYVFYCSASWCGYCQKYTPALVDFYKKHKSDKFEIVLITC